MGVYLLLCVNLLAEYKSIIDIDVIFENLADSHHGSHLMKKKFCLQFSNTFEGMDGVGERQWS